MIVKSDFIALITKDRIKIMKLNSTITEMRNLLEGQTTI